MNVFRPRQKLQPTQGSALLVTMVFAVICGITLGSYFTLAGQEHRMVVRSQNWNAALAMAEAGVDEALAQMNATNVTSGDFSPNGWGANGTNYGPVTRTLVGGSYSIGIVGGAVPTIYATGFVSVAGTGQTMSRRVKVTTTSQQVSPFSVGLGAVANINMNGNSIASDSWNSTTNSESTNGLYNGYVGTNGSVASVGGVVNIGNHTIDGNLYLGPTATYDSSTGLVSGRIYYDYNVQFPDATLPTTDTNGNPISWQTPDEVSSGSKKPTYSYDFTSANNNGYYVINNSDPITVEAGVTVTLQVTIGSFAPANIAIIGGTTNSGSIIMYHNPASSGSSATLGGNATGGAPGNRPVNFIYFGLPNVTAITFGGTSTFVGAIYAPEATLTLNGGGSAYNLEGSAIVNSVTLNGHYDFHYDESLAHWLNGPNRGYIPVSWQEF